MSRAPGRGIFCGRTGDLTKQHVFPNRIRRLVPRTETETVSLKTDNFFSRTKGDAVRGRNLDRRNGATAATKLRIVCRKCNAGWMRALEEAAFLSAEDLILGKPIVLSPAQQAAIARLGVNIAMVAAMLAREQKRYTPEERRQFMETGNPPKDFYVFLAYNGSDKREPFFSHLSDYIVNLDGSIGDRKYITFTVIIGCLAIQVFVAGVGNTFQENADGYGGAFGAARIWPPRAFALDLARLPILDKEGIRKLFSSISKSEPGKLVA